MTLYNNNKRVNYAKLKITKCEVWQ